MAATDSVWPKTSILDAIKHHGLSKDQGTQMLRVKYGEMLVKGQIISSPKEQQVIKLIMKLHEDGQSFRQIAKHLNDKKIKSKKGGKWDKSVVTSIVCRQREEKK
ncbi:MAG: recombinase family protein [Halobacteriovoraceae bacterium]|nr:recombinase family protein [Halobacteriovoraceae bacterium]